MTAVRRLAGYRAAAFTLVLLFTVVSVVQIVGRPPEPALREPAGFAVTPRGAEVARTAPVTVTFATSPDERTPEKLFVVDPPALGTYAWLSARTVLFQPDFPGFIRGSTYTVHVAPRPEAGLPEPVTSAFTVTGQLTVQQLIPADGDTEVPLEAPIIVQFSRSVAPLTTLAAQRSDRVVRFDPPLEGRGEWLNTAIYRYTPARLQPSTTYQVTIPKGLTSAADGVLASDVVASFRTIAPAVAAMTPEANTQFAAPRQPVVVRFNQPMDRSAAADISLLEPGGASVAGSVAWSENDTVATFTPDGRLAPNTKYVTVVAKGLRGARGGETATARTAGFTTAALPRIAQTSPGDGDTNAGRYGISIQFATPMDPTSLEGKIRISGFTADELDGHVFTSEQALSANVPLRASTAYTVELAPGATDRYGQPMGGHRFAFTTGALPATVSLALPGYSSSATYSASAEPILYFQATNLPSASFILYPLTPDEGRRVLHDPGQAVGDRFTPSLAPLRSWTEEIAGAKDTVVLGSTSLSGGGPLPKGYYFVRTGGAMRSQFAFAVVDTVIVTKLSQDELLVWAVDHDTGAPVGGATIRAAGAGITPEDARTDASGLASFSVPTPTLGKGIDRSYLVWIDAGGRNAIMSTRWQQGISSYQFGFPADYFTREWVGHLYTDRPIYRPGETVELKGVVRADDDARYRVPPRDTPLQLLISNPRGQQVSREDVALNEFGTFAGRFTVPADAPLGSYAVGLQVKGGPPQAGPFIVSASVTVAEFRAPEFQVTLTTPRASYTDGEDIEVQAAASFFFGGALVGAPVRWSALAESSALRVAGYERYSFSDSDPSRRSVSQEPLRATGTATTGADGTVSYRVPATIKLAEGAQRYTLSATVADQNGQAVAGSTVVTVHPASLYVGVHPAQYVATEGRDATVELVTVDSDGSVAPERAVVVKVYARDWITTKEQIPGGGRRYQSEPRDTLVTTIGATTGVDGKAAVTVRPTKPGTLRIVGEITDAQGRTERSAAYLWVAGIGFASWQVTNDDTLKLVADREQYAPGDIAEILVPAPFAGATALVTVERGKLVTREVRTLATNSERVRIPITDRSIPDVFVSVVLYRPPTASDPIPRFKVGYVQLSVSTAARVLTVRAQPDRPQAKPGDTVHYDIAVTGPDGRGVRSEVSIAVVDRAVLSLQEERGPDGLRAFWFERGLGVNTASSMAVSVDRWNDVVVEAARAGKGGSGGGLTADRERQTFRNTAYWSAQVVTNDDGTAGVDVKLPDNLTTWRMQVRAVSGDTLVGEGTNELVATKPLLLRPAFPRFLRTGDAVDLRVLVRNATATDSEVRVALQATGVQVRGDLARSVSVAAGASVIVSWPATATTEGTASLAVSATGTGGLGDSVTQQLPVLLDVTPETMSTGGIVTNEGALESVYLPPFANTSRGSLRVQVRSALAGSMADELPELVSRPLEGAERVASRLIASLGVRRAERSAGIGPTTSAGRITSDLAGLVGRQRPDGSWAWCDDPQCLSDPNVTGWALIALGEARRDGLTVDDGVVSRATAYVAQVLDRTTDVAAPADPSPKALLLAALAAAGERTTVATRARALFEQQRARLSSWGRAALILALTDAGVAADDVELRALLDDLAAATIATANGNHWEDPPVRGTFLTNTGATALGVLALVRVAPAHALLAQTVRWLVVAHGAEGWRTSTERALGVLALTSYAVATGELAGDYGYAVLLDGTKLLTGTVSKGSAPATGSGQVPLSALTPGRPSGLAVTRDYGRPGRLYYTVDLRYTTPAATVEAVNRGFAVSHEYTTVEDPSRPIASAKSGDTVRVKLTVLVPADRSYVTIEDLLPAGLEPVDARLRTVDPALKAKLEADRASAAQRQAGGYAAPWYRWYYSPWQQVDLRDDRAVLSADRVPKGVYEYVYYARATTPGDFFVAPAHAEEAYFPEVFGRSDSSRFTVTP